MTVPEILRQAAVEVRQGWVQNTMECPRHHVCALGAIQRTIGWKVFEPLTDDAYFRYPAVAALGAAIHGRDIYSISRWNDAADQTAENVATTMEFAAVLAEQAAGAATRSAPQEEAPCLLTRA